MVLVLLFTLILEFQHMNNVMKLAILLLTNALKWVSMDGSFLKKLNSSISLPLIMDKDLELRSSKMVRTK